MQLAVITGASSGIGAATARRLASDRFRVVLLARRRSEPDRLAGQIGSQASVAVCDASNGEAVLETSGRVLRDIGVPDVLVNCAGAGQWKYIEETSPAEALAMIQAPYLAAFNVTHAFMRGMLEKRHGVVVHVNSPASSMVWPSCTGYAASRWALRGLHEALCQDLAGTGVRSCHVVFGKVSSAYFEHNPGTEDRIPGIARTIRTLTPVECADVIAGVVRSPRRETFHPFMLRFYSWNHRVVPGMVSWLARSTGRSRA